MQKILKVALIGLLTLVVLVGCANKDKTVSDVVSEEMVEDVATEESVSVPEVEVPEVEDSDLEVPEVEVPEVEVPEVDESVEATTEKTDLSGYEPVELPEFEEKDGVTYYYDDSDTDDIDWDAFVSRGDKDNSSVLKYQNLSDKEYPSGITMADIESGTVTDEMLLYLVEKGVVNYMAQFGADHDYTIGEFFGEEVGNYFSEIYPYEEMDVIREKYKGEFLEAGHKIQTDDTIADVNNELIGLSTWKLFN